MNGVAREGQGREGGGLAYTGHGLLVSDPLLAGLMTPP